MKIKRMIIIKMMILMYQIALQKLKENLYNQENLKIQISKRMGKFKMMYSILRQYDSEDNYRDNMVYDSPLDEKCEILNLKNCLECIFFIKNYF